MPRKSTPRALVLSPTRIRIFRECEAQYRLEYIDRLGKIFHRPRAGFSFGTSLHRTLESLPCRRRRRRWLRARNSKRP